jgi:hypothetical protein
LCAVPNTAGLCISLISCFSNMLRRYCVSDFEMVPYVNIIISVNLVFTFHMRCIYIVNHSHYRPMGPRGFWEVTSALEGGRLSALRNGRLYPLECPGTHF